MSLAPFKTFIQVTDTLGNGYLTIVGEGATQAEADAMAESQIVMMRCIIVSYYRSQLITPLPVAPFSINPGSTNSCQLWLVNATAVREPAKLYLIDGSFLNGITINSANASVQSFINAWRDDNQQGGYSLQASLVTI